MRMRARPSLEHADSFHKAAGPVHSGNRCRRQEQSARPRQFVQGADDVTVLDHLEGDNRVERVGRYSERSPVRNVSDDVGWWNEVQTDDIAESLRLGPSLDPTVGTTDIEHLCILFNMREEEFQLARARDATQRRNTWLNCLPVTLGCKQTRPSY